MKESSKNVEVRFVNFLKDFEFYHFHIFLIESFFYMKPFNSLTIECSIYLKNTSVATESP